MSETRSPVLFREVQDGAGAVELVTEVRPDGLYVGFAPLRGSFHAVPFDAIETVAVTEYTPTDYGDWSWGVRTGPTGATRAYRIAGDEGVEITRADARDLFVGSRRPRALADAIRAARTEG